MVALRAACSAKGLNVRAVEKKLSFSWTGPVSWGTFAIVNHRDRSPPAAMHGGFCVDARGHLMPVRTLLAPAVGAHTRPTSADQSRPAEKSGDRSHQPVQQAPCLRPLAPPDRPSVA